MKRKLSLRNKQATTTGDKIDTGHKIDFDNCKQTASIQHYHYLINQDKSREVLQSCTVFNPAGFFLD